MTRHAVQYESSSKGAVDIDSMATPHLARAAKKIIAAEVTDPGYEQVLTCMIDELASRATSVKAKKVLEAAVAWHHAPIEGIRSLSAAELALGEAVDAYAPQDGPPLEDDRG